MQIDIVGLIVTWLIMSLSFFIISKLPLGVEIDSLNKVLVSAAVFGVLNALIKPVLFVLGFPFVVLTLGLFASLSTRSCLVWRLGSCRDSACAGGFGVRS